LVNHKTKLANQYTWVNHETKLVNQYTWVNHEKNRLSNTHIS